MPPSSRLPWKSCEGTGSRPGCTAGEQVHGQTREAGCCQLASTGMMPAGLQALASPRDAASPAGPSPCPHCLQATNPLLPCPPARPPGPPPKAPPLQPAHLWRAAAVRRRQASKEEAHAGEAARHQRRCRKVKQICPGADHRLELQSSTDKIHRGIGWGVGWGGGGGAVVGIRDGWFCVGVMGGCRSRNAQTDCTPGATRTTV